MSIPNPKFKIDQIVRSNKLNDPNRHTFIIKIQAMIFDCQKNHYVYVDRGGGVFIENDLEKLEDAVMADCEADSMKIYKLSQTLKQVIALTIL